MSLRALKTKTIGCDMNDSPWKSEPDEYRFEHRGVSCVMLRGPLHHWCGYVQVPKDHPWFGIDYNHCYRVDQDYLSVHGGLTYGQENVPYGTKDEKGWWVGFDCAHLGDYCPGMTQFSFESSGDRVYRDMNYVENQLMNLVDQMLEHIDERA